MNDFTKEELEYILNSLGPYCGDDSATHDPYSGYLPGLYTKVLDMIDNYCDHEGKTNSNSDVDYILTCSQCDAFKGWV